MKSYSSYDALAIDLDLHFFDKISVLSQVGKPLKNGKWFVVTDDGGCHLFDKHGNLDDIRKLHILTESSINKDIKKIIIPDFMTIIGNYMFWNCDRLTNVTIGNNVTNVGRYAFYGCKNLKHVFFKGKTLRQVKAMYGYPWEIKDEDIIKAELK
jgi:hypothetical protein